MKNRLILAIAIPIGLLGLGCILAPPFAKSKEVAQKKPSKDRWASTFGSSERFIAKGDISRALTSLRTIQSSPNQLLAGEATRRIAETLLKAGRPREAFDQYARLVVMSRTKNYSNSRVTDGLIHASMASIALDLNDDAMFQRTVRDLSFQMNQTSLQIRDEISRRMARTKGAGGPEAAKHFKAQVQDISEAAGSPPLVAMARALAQQGDIPHRDRVYELAIGTSRDTRLLKEYGDRLDATHQPRAALRIFSSIPEPYPKDIELSIREALRTLSYRVSIAPKISEKEEQKLAVEKLASLRSRVWATSTNSNSSP